MPGFYQDPFEENLGEFFNARLKEARWEKQDGASGVLYQAEVAIPIVMHYTDLMQAEAMTVTYQSFLNEWYDLIEVSALELIGGKPVTFASNWKLAPERMAQLFLKYMTTPAFAKYLNAEYPKDAFGEKIIQVYASAAICRAEDGNIVVMFAGWVVALTQDKNDRMHYIKNATALETIY